MRVVLNKGKWFLLALFVFVLPFGVARANSFASQGDMLQCVQVETDTSGDRLGDDYRLATATSTTVECGETSVAGSSLGDRSGDDYRLATATSTTVECGETSVAGSSLGDRSGDDYRLATASTSEPATGDTLAEVYWDPTSGVDTNDGATSSTPVKSVDKAKELAGDSGKICMCGQLTISEDTTLDFNNRTIVLCTGVTGTAFFYMSGNCTLTVNNVVFTSENSKSISLYVFNGTSASLNLNDVKFDNISSSAEALFCDILNINLNDVKFEEVNVLKIAMFTQANITCNLTGCVLDGGDFRYETIHTKGQNPTVNIKNCTVTNNRFYYNLVSFRSSTGGTLSVEGGEFKNNTKMTQGLIWIQNTGTTTTFTNCTIGGLEGEGNVPLANNADSKGDVTTLGAVIYASESDDSTLIVNSGTYSYNSNGSLFMFGGKNSKITINGGTFSNNTGSGIVSSSKTIANGSHSSILTVMGTRATVNIYGGTFNDNSNASYGGVIYVVNGALVIDGTKFGSTVKFCGNESKSIGGVAFVQGGSGVEMSDCEVSNSTGQGAIVSKVKTVIRKCTFTNNSSTSFGALYIDNDLEAYNCTFNGNTSQNNGGAIYAQKTAIIDKCWFEDNENTASAGGAVYTGSNVTVTGGTFLGNESKKNGGAIASGSGSAILRNSTFENNFSSNWGGAVFCWGVCSEVTGCTFTGNQSGNTAGAIGSYGGASTPIVLKDCHFINNTGMLKAWDNGGGAVYVVSEVSVIDCEFKGNKGTKKNGGALYSPKKITIEGGEFRENSSVAGYGGAIYSSEEVSTTGCTFYGNTSAGDGGAIYCSGKITAKNSPFSDNTSGGAGGAVYVYQYDGVSEITDCNFENNSAQTQGGALFCGDLKLVCENSSMSIKGNKSGNSGAVMRSGVATFVGTETYPMIFDGNSSSNYGGCVWAWGDITASYCQFLNNTSYQGGGVCALIYGKATFNNCTFTNNKQKGGWTGGGVLHKYTEDNTTYSQDNTYTFTDCDFTDNYATSGGGIFNLGHSSTYYQGTANLSFSGCTFSDSTGADALEEGQTTKLGDNMNGAIVYVGSKATVNLELSFENFETKGVGLFYVASGGTFNYSNSTLYNTRATYGVIYNLGTANLTNLTIAGCNGSSIGPLYCGGSGVMTVTNLSTTYTSNSVTTKGNKNDYGGTLAIGEIYDTDNKALLKSDGKTALTIAGGTVEFVNSAIKGPETRDDAANPVTLIGGGVYAGKDGIFNMRSGRVHGNSSKTGGRQIHLQGGTANIYGEYRYDYKNREVIKTTGSYIGYTYNGDISIMVENGSTLNVLGGYIYNFEVHNGGKTTVNGALLTRSRVQKGAEVKIANAFYDLSDWGYADNIFGAGSEVEFVNCYINGVLDHSSYNYFVYNGQDASARFTNCVFEECQVNGTNYVSSTDRPSLFKNFGGTIEFEWCEFLNGKDTLFYSNPNYSTSKYIFNNCTVSNNTCSSKDVSAGHIGSFCNGGVEFYDTTFISNIGEFNTSGTAIKSFVIDSCEFKKNHSNPYGNYPFIGLQYATFEINNIVVEDTNANMLFQMVYADGKITNSSLLNNSFTWSPISMSIEPTQTIILENCTFENNQAKLGGVVNVYSGMIEVIDCEFTQNFADAYNGVYPTDSSYGAAISCRNNAYSTPKLTLGGTIRITNNHTYLVNSMVSGDSAKRDEFTPSGGGIYVADGATLNIKQNTLLICKDNYREVEQSDGTTIKYADNLYIASSNKMILEGDLNEGSDFGLGCMDTRDSENQIVLEEKDALLSKGENYPVTNKLLEIASLDNENYELRFVYLKDNKNGLVFYPKERSTYWLLCNDLVVDYDPAKTQTINTPTLMWGDIEYTEDYRIKYLNGNGEYKLDKPTFSEIGSYAVQYIVECLNEKLEWTTLIVGEETMTGETSLRILGRRLVVEEYPVAHLNYGETLNYAKFYGGVVKDAEGQTVTGIWEFVNSDTVGENGKSYVAKFTPSNTINVMESSIQMLQNVSVEVQTLYPYVFYSKGYFRTKINGDSSTIINITDLQTMVDNMPDNGTLVFCETYTISSNQMIEVKDKSINFVRYRLFKYSIDSSGNYSSTGDPMPMIAVDGVDASLTLKGDIYFEGLAPYSGAWSFNVSYDYSHIKMYALIEVGKSGNGGSLTLGEGVVIRNWAVKIDTANVGLITIYANASAELDGCEIYGNRIIVQDGLDSSVITNNGTLNIKSGKFMNNILVDGSKYASNRTSVGVSATPFSKGGFLVCNTGSTTVIDGGEIYSNRAQYGGAIYVNTNATLTLNGGQIYANRGYTSGGAIYLEDATMTVGSSCEISGNMSGGNSAIAFNDSTQATVTVVDASGTGVSGASAMLALNSIDEQNQSFVNFALIDGVETTVASDQSVVDMALLFSGLCLVFVCIVTRRFYIKKQRKFSKK